MRRVVLGWSLLAWLVCSPVWALPQESQPVEAGTVRVAVLAFRPKPETQARWQPLIDYLNQTLPQYRFRLDAYTYPELEAVVARGSIDFILTQPSHYVLLTYRNGLSSLLATLVEKSGAMSQASFGGVIVTRADRADLKDLADLRGQRLATSSMTSLGSYQTQALELMRAGVRLPEDASVLETGQPQDRAIEAVLQGEADAGFVRTGVIEAMVREGRLDPMVIKLIHAQVMPGFPDRLSTRLYPEWPFAAMPRVNPELARRVAATLLAMPHDGPLARSMGIDGFTIPGDYRPIDELLRALRLPPFDEAPVFGVHDVWERFQGAIASGAGVGSLALSMLAFGLFTSNRRLKREVSERQRAEGQLIKLSQAVEQSPNAVVITDLDARIEYVNAAFEKTTGYTAEEVIGRVRASWTAATPPARCSTRCGCT